MAGGKETIWEKFWQPVVRLLMDEAELSPLYKNIDWKLESGRYRNPQIAYPEYYTQQNFHGMTGGYLNPKNAIAYDRFTQYFLPPQEILVRQESLDRIQGTPQRILDLGCGTGSSTLMLQEKFPQASITGIDLSPYMLVMASYKAKQKTKQAGLEIHWQQGNAEQTGFPAGYFDLVTASLLFNEIPGVVSQAIVRECFRILKSGGQLLILDGFQPVLRQLNWLQEIFKESGVSDPDLKDYAKGNLDAWLEAAGFGTVTTQELWLVHQITSGFKPQPVQTPWAYPGMELDDFAGGFALIP